MTLSEGESEELTKDHGVLYMGIDLGTSRTSVSASNGVRETVESFVGYPKDPVARKLLKRDVLFGEDAREHRLSLNLFRPLEHGVLKFNKDGTEDSDNLRAARDLIREIIRLAKPRKDELVYAVIGAPAQASIHNKEAIMQRRARDGRLGDAVLRAVLGRLRSRHARGRARDRHRRRHRGPVSDARHDARGHRPDHADHGRRLHVDGAAEHG